MKLTSLQKRVLRELKNRGKDIIDLSDDLSQPVFRIVQACTALEKSGMIEWMYDEDEIVLLPAGREALRTARRGK